MGKKDKAEDAVLEALDKLRAEQQRTRQAIKKLSPKVKKKVKRRRGLALALLFVAAVFVGYLFFPDLLSIPPLGVEWLIIGTGAAIVLTVFYGRRGLPIIAIMAGLLVTYFFVSGEDLLPWFARIWPMVPGGLTGWSVLILAIVTLIVLSRRGALKGQGEGIWGIIGNLFSFRLGGLKIVVVVIVFVVAWMWFLEISASDLLVDRWYFVNPRILEAVVPALLIAVALDWIIKQRKSKNE